jgi:hypothetical protein
MSLADEVARYRREYRRMRKAPDVVRLPVDRYFGVYRRPNERLWRARIWASRDINVPGNYPTAREAAIAREQILLSLLAVGPCRARRNFPDGIPALAGQAQRTSNHRRRLT